MHRTRNGVQRGFMAPPVMQATRERTSSCIVKLTCCLGGARCDKAVAKGQGSRCRHSSLQSSSSADIILLRTCKASFWFAHRPGAFCQSSERAGHVSKVHGAYSGHLCLLCRVLLRAFSSGRRT